ncbi:sporulation protein YjcZ [Bacillus xiapuensis]|uniref:Sporulation protein YjcZ n=1 Tax=Bacillus xiapuensis TaxID=2014075 RepID=A0ABU6NBK8_9BACI|nr:sporulation protein YjcZ [Bacillus xiapuensis]
MLFIPLIIVGAGCY